LIVPISPSVGGCAHAIRLHLLLVSAQGVHPSSVHTKYQADKLPLGFGAMLVASKSRHDIDIFFKPPPSQPTWTHFHIAKLGLAKVHDNNYGSLLNVFDILTDSSIQVSKQCSLLKTTLTEIFNSGASVARSKQVYMYSS
jgi:hypothetical protein